MNIEDLKLENAHLRYDMARLKRVQELYGSCWSDCEHPDQISWNDTCELCEGNNGRVFNSEKLIEGIDEALWGNVDCPECEGHGWIVELQQRCCRKGQHECCGDPDIVQIQVHCPVCNPYIPPVKDDDLPF